MDGEASLSQAQNSLTYAHARTRVPTHTNTPNTHTHNTQHLQQLHLDEAGDDVAVHRRRVVKLVQRLEV